MNVEIEKIGTELEVEILGLLEVISPVTFSTMTGFVNENVEKCVKNGYELAEIKVYVRLERQTTQMLDKNRSNIFVYVEHPWAKVCRSFPESPKVDFVYPKQKNTAIGKYKILRERLNQILLTPATVMDGMADIQLKPKIVPEKDTFSLPVSQSDVKKVIDSINPLPTEKEVMEYVDGCLKHEKTERLFDPNEYWNKEGEKDTAKAVDYDLDY